MTSSSGIPRPFSITDAKRSREEEARKREQATSARNTSSTTIGSGGRLDVVGGDLTISEGGNASVKDGGRFLVEGGGSMEIVDDGEVRITGGVYDSLTDGVRVAQVSLRTEEITHENVAWTTRRPGIFFSTDGVEGASIHSFKGEDANVVSGTAPVTYGPLVGPDINQATSVYVAPGNTALTASAFYKTGTDMTDSRAQCVALLAPDSMLLQLYQDTVGEIGSIRVSIDDPKLRLSGRDGVDVKGPFTVDGLPVVGGVTSVNTKTGDVVLAKGDIGLGNVDNTTDAAKPVSTATATALGGKASTAVATTSANGLMSSADKTKLDTLGAANTAKQVLAPLQPTGWKVEGDVFTEPFGSVTRISMSVKCIRTGAAITAPAGTFQNLGAVVPLAARSTTGVQTYQSGWLMGGASPVLGTIFINPSSGELLFNPSASITFGTNWGFTLAHTWSK